MLGGSGGVVSFSTEQHSEPNLSGREAFLWRREPWWHLPPVSAQLPGGIDSSSARTLLSSLHWLHSTIRKRESRLPGVIVDCGADAISESAKLFETFGGSAPSAGQVARTSEDKQVCTRPLGVVALSIEPSATRLEELRLAGRAANWDTAFAWRAELAQLSGAAGGSSSISSNTTTSSVPLARRTLKEAVRLAAGAISERPLARPIAFLLRAGHRCGLLSALHGQLGSGDMLVKFVLLSAGGQGRRTLDRAPVVKGLLCFCMTSSGRLHPVFGPFADSRSSCEGDALCGWEEDPDLDTLVQLLSGGGFSAGPPPARWGAAAGAEADGPGVLPGRPGARHGRFLYAAASSAAS
mmetsp:Transcript_45220/g.144894  ORF Transcript_45220/g.144894 Transcript_45220/m.144894 type:complete len:352 (-) Transcript_45220:38-1093(-)